ncbi:hypothetical protein BLS_009269 [Venturia inaequalis]|uniref:Ankyrin n=1 Tax=Venturia inaequalis TaxID=5025 RepID=A0A8H3U5K4_VENIN|nr:hypothetical protein BLS_009269 [Venturia inaequalis]KAE9968879.1 hypothetical protein EG328_007192 [Venturia inaequalis]
MSFLAEEEIDDVLYCARANDLEELKSFISTLDTKYTSESPASIILAAVDSETGNNAAHYACGNGHQDVIKYLLSQFPADSSPSSKSLLIAQNKAGNTALHWAALNGHLEMVKLLLQSGADVSILNVVGHDAVYEAEINDKDKVVDFLLKEGVGLDTGLGGAEGEDAEEEVKDDPNVTEGAVNGSVDSVDDVKKELEKMEIKDNGTKEEGG